MKVITLCGSTRFKDEFAKQAARLSLEGHLVITVNVFSRADLKQITQEQHDMLDEIHLRKIDMADEIFVINPGNYIGEGLTREIAYARRTNKPVVYLEEV